MNSLIHSIPTRRPARHEMLLVFGVVVFAVYGWSIRGFLYKLPSFSLYFGLGSNLAILCYMMAFALLESLLVMALLLLLAVLLPASWLKTGFAYKGFLIVLVASIAMIVFENWYKSDFFKDIMAGMTYPFAPFVGGLVGSLIVLAALLWLVSKQPRLQHYVVLITEQMSLFTYIYVPLGLIGLVVVFVRNL